MPMKNIILLIFLSLLFFISCDLPEGEGGKTTIRGHVYMLRYNSDFSRIIQEYYVGKYDVYIVYGNDTTTYHDDVETHFDGSYEFRYLREGDYTIYAYSKDSNSITGLPEYPVMQKVKVSKNDELVEVEDIIVVDN